MSSTPACRALALVGFLLLGCGPTERSAPVARSSAAASSCAWEPRFGTVNCYQGDWWVEFSVASAATTLEFEVAGAVVALPWRFDFGDGLAKFTGGPDDGPLTAGTSIRLHATNASGQRVSSAWFPYRRAAPVAECGPCVPSCPAGTCGNDGCGGECACATGAVCLADDTCCVPNANPCGPDGCGGSHGECPCTPSCAPGTCGNDGCGGACVCSGGARCVAGVCCSPSCAPGRCGSDGCGGTCACAAGTTCRGGVCCTPSCAPGTCGSDGCGGTCACAAGSPCVGGVCCTPGCAPGSCGSDGCGGTCACAAGSSCVGGVCCTPSCAPGTCASDGCGGTCACAAGSTCFGGVCCAPSCAPGTCGSDGCGGTCACAAGTRCVDLLCCAPSCAPGTCGSDGCGGTCTCAGGERCVDQQCCAPSCAPGACGNDGCGGSCACPSGAVCTAALRCCTPSCSGRSCGDDGCGGSCGACASGQTCDGTACVGGCVPPWSPTWQQGNGSPYWVEYQVVGGGSLAREVWLERVGQGVVTTLAQYWTGFAGWGGNLPSGTQVILHARDATGATAQTVPFRFLVDRAPLTDPCAGAPGPSPSCRPLARGLLSLTMDDSVSSQVELARPVLARYGFKATVYEVVSQLQSYPIIPEAQLMAAEGHEIGSHSRTHDFLTTLGPAALEDETGGARAWLEAHVTPTVDSFASPMGDYNATTLAAIKRHYASHRTVNPGLNYMGTSVYELGVGSSFSDVSVAEICAQISEAAQRRGWLILVFHDFTSAPTTPYWLSYPIAGFERVLACARDTPGLDVVTVRQGAAALACASPP